MTTRLPLLLLAAWLPSAACAADDPAPEVVTSTNVQVQVLDVVILSSNRVAVGSNRMSVVDAARYVGEVRDSVDVLAIHDARVGEGAVLKGGNAVTRLAQLGVPLVIVEDEGQYRWRERAGTEGVRTLSLGTAQLATLRRLWGGSRTGTEESETEVRTSVRWDAEAGTYELDRVELGLFGKDVWLLHEQGERDDDGTGTVGIQFKREW